MDLIKNLCQLHIIDADGLEELLNSEDSDLRQKLFRAAQRVAWDSFQDKVYIRGLIEFTSYCAKNCYYCGLRAENSAARRYRMTTDEILDACKKGYRMGFRTFVLQGGEDRAYPLDEFCALIRRIKLLYPSCAVTLSLGEMSYEDYEELHEAGADRYLLRQETANELQYTRLHPSSYSAEDRQACLFELKKIGYQVGAGFLIGAPYETPECHWDNLVFLQRLDPAMIGIGPFLPQGDTPFRHQPPGDIETTLRWIAILRILFPHALIPATTALGTLHRDGLIMGIMAGANVVMPNLTPKPYNEEYALYDGKAEKELRGSIDNLAALDEALHAIGKRIVVDRGDYKK